MFITTWYTIHVTENRERNLVMSRIKEILKEALLRRPGAYRDPFLKNLIKL